LNSFYKEEKKIYIKILKMAIDKSKYKDTLIMSFVLLNNSKTKKIKIEFYKNNFKIEIIIMYK
jgi:hypothetical protein